MSTVGAELRRLEQQPSPRDPLLDNVDGDIYLEIFSANAIDMPEVKCVHFYDRSKRCTCSYNFHL